MALFPTEYTQLVGQKVEWPPVLRVEAPVFGKCDNALVHICSKHFILLVSGAVIILIGL